MSALEDECPQCHHEFTSHDASGRCAVRYCSCMSSTMPVCLCGHSAKSHCEEGATDYCLDPYCPCKEYRPADVHTLLECPSCGHLRETHDAFGRCQFFGCPCTTLPGRAAPEKQPVCPCGHKKDAHGSFGCVAFDGGAPCPCKVTRSAFELGPDPDPEPDVEHDDPDPDPDPEDEPPMRATTKCTRKYCSHPYDEHDDRGGACGAWNDGTYCACTKFKAPTAPKVPAEPYGSERGTQGRESELAGAKARRIASGASGDGDIGSLLANALGPYLRDIALDEGAVRRIIAEEVTKLSTLRVEVLKDGLVTKTLETSVHRQFPELLYYVSHRQHVLLWGPVGAGKTTAARLVADACSMEFSYIALSPQTPESRLFGYSDAGGRYISTPFRRAYEHGGVFLVDEIDNANPTLLTSLNGALDNGLAAFPDAIVKRHEAFVCVGSANTNGLGGSDGHLARQVMDNATRERFAFIDWGYDETLERTAALAENPDAGKWVDFVQKVRKAVQKQKLRLAVSPRASIYGARALRDGRPQAEVEAAFLWKGFDAERVAQIKKDVK